MAETCLPQLQRYSVPTNEKDRQGHKVTLFKQFHSNRDNLA